MCPRQQLFHLDFVVGNPDPSCSLPLGNGADQIRAQPGTWWGSELQLCVPCATSLSQHGTAALTGGFLGEEPSL